MENIWSRKFRDFQEEIISKICNMSEVGKKSKATLMVQSSGIGKSIFYQTIGSMYCGISIIIEPTLSLSADQKSKIELANSPNKPIVSFHLVLIKINNDAKKIQ